MQKNCKQCGGEFATEFPDKMYCAPKCKKAAQRFRQGIQPRVRRGWKAGDRFGMLVLKEFLTPDKRPDKTRQFWLCDCDCGTKDFKARADKLKNGRTRSCGCQKAEVMHQALERLTVAKQEQSALLDKLRVQNNQRSKDVQRKHQSLQRFLRVYENIPSTDPLWRLNYYAEIIADGCHYCGGPLEEEGCSLALIDLSLDLYWAPNVIPACQPCQSRRATHRDVLSFREMEILGQTLELIRLSRNVEIKEEEDYADQEAKQLIES